MGEMIQFSRPDGKSASGYLALPKEPNNKNAPAVIVIQEWWGLNDQIKGICDRYAQAGYRALAPDLYEGKATADPAEAGKLMRALDMKLATDQIVRGAAHHLKKDGAGKIGLTGFCMGGAVTLMGAAMIPEISAGVCYYGIPASNNFKPEDVKAPVQCHYGKLDKFITPDKVYQLEAAMKAAKVNAEFHMYDADHAFANEKRPEVYNKAAADVASKRALDFFAKHLK